MKPIPFDGADTTFAEDQHEYQPLPAQRFGDADGTVLFCWRLSLIERLTLLLTGKLWHQVMTFNKPLQPQLLSVDRPQY